MVIFSKKITKSSKRLFGMTAYRFPLPWVDKSDETFSAYNIFLALISSHNCSNLTLSWPGQGKFTLPSEKSKINTEDVNIFTGFSMTFNLILLRVCSESFIAIGLFLTELWLFCQRRLEVILYFLYVPSFYCTNRWSSLSRPLSRLVSCFMQSCCAVLCFFDCCISFFIIVANIDRDISR